MKCYTRTWWLAHLCVCVCFFLNFCPGKSRKQQQDMMSVMSKVGHGVMQRRIEWEHSNPRFQKGRQFQIDQSGMIPLHFHHYYFIDKLIMTSCKKNKNKLIDPSFLLTWAYTKIQDSLFLKHHSKYSGTKNLFNMIT
jgi:hypothetical protein